MEERNKNLTGRKHLSPPQDPPLLSFTQKTARGKITEITELKSCEFWIHIWTARIFNEYSHYGRTYKLKLSILELALLYTGLDIESNLFNLNLLFIIFIFFYKKDILLNDFDWNN